MISEISSFPAFSSYPLLHNKLPKNVVAENKKHLLAHCFCGLGIRKQLSWVVLMRLQSGCWPGLQSPKDLTKPKGSA